MLTASNHGLIFFYNRPQTHFQPWRYCCRYPRHIRAVGEAGERAGGAPLSGRAAGLRQGLPAGAEKLPAAYPYVL